MATNFVVQFPGNTDWLVGIRSMGIWMWVKTLYPRFKERKSQPFLVMISWEWWLENFPGLVFFKTIFKHNKPWQLLVIESTYPICPTKIDRMIGCLSRGLQSYTLSVEMSQRCAPHQPPGWRPGRCVGPGLRCRGATVVSSSMLCRAPRKLLNESMVES